MKIENLKEGMVIKNYRELCEVLEIEYSGGNKKKKQIKELERFISYENKGNSFIIKEIYETPLEEDNNITKHIDIIEKLILHYILVNGTENKLHISKPKFKKLLNMVNVRYGEMKYHKMQLSEKMNIPKEVIMDFYTTSDDLLERNIERALNNLKSKSLIMWGHAFTVVKIKTESILDPFAEYSFEEEVKEDAYGDEYSEVYFKREPKYIHSEATDYETKIILGVQRDIMESYGFDNLKDLMNQGIFSNFSKSVKAKLRNDYFIDNYYECYSLTYNEDYILDSYNRIDAFKLDEESLFLIKEIINKSVVYNIKENGKKRNDKAMKNIGSSKLLEVRKAETYTRDVDNLTDSLVVIQKYNRV